MFSIIIFCEILSSQNYLFLFLKNRVLYFFSKILKFLHLAIFSDKFLKFIRIYITENTKEINEGKNIAMIVDYL